MNKMRQNTGVILWILVISFGGIWVLQDSGAFDSIGQQRSRNIAVVNGEPITYEEYSQALQQQIQQYEQRTGNSVSPQMRDRFRQQTYDALINDKLRQQAMARMGIQVANSEIVDMVLGENPDPFIRQQFGDGQGNIDRNLLQQVIQNPRSRQQWLQVESYLQNKRRQQKFTSLLGSAVRVTEEQIKDVYVRRNTTRDVEFVALLYAAIPNDSVDVTEEELRSYYQDNRDQFERERTYTLSYVEYPKTPTPEDTTRIIKELRDLKPRFAEAEDDSAFLSQQASAKPYTDAYFQADELTSGLAGPVFDDPQPGDVVGPILTQGQVHLVKIKDVREASETDGSDLEVQIADLAREIRPSVATLTDLENQAMDLQYYAEESTSFQEEAQKQEKEIQQVQVQQGTETIPGLGYSAQVNAFLENAETGEVSDAIELDDAFVVLKVQEIQEAGYRPFEEVRSQILPQVRTQKKRERQVERLTQAYERHSFAELPSALNTEMRTASDLAMTTRTVEPLGQEPQFVGVAFGLEEGETSTVTAGQNGAFVLRVTGIDRPDPASITQAEKQAIRKELMRRQQQQVSQQWMSHLRDQADIQDYRHRFFNQRS